MRRRQPDAARLIEAYGDHELNVGEWFIPSGDAIAPTVVIIHGGFWRPEYDRHIQHHVANDLATNGYLCWNIDYRSAAAPWPATLTDVAAAYDHLQVSALAARIDPSRIAVTGHSAGGHLAAWLASRHRLPPEAPGHNPGALLPALAIPQAGVVALQQAAESKLGRGAAQMFIGGSPETRPDRYAVADPLALLPTGVRSVLIHPQRDRVVPVRQSRLYVEQATAAGDDSRLEVCRGDHYAHLDTKSEAHRLLLEALSSMSA